MWRSNQPAGYARPISPATTSQSCRRISRRAVGWCAIGVTALRRPAFDASTWCRFDAARSIIRGTNFVVPEEACGAGSASELTVVDAVRDWYHSPGYQNGRRHRHFGADYAAIIVEGA
jgi:Domain of unknown function (DUF1330)